MSNHNPKFTFIDLFAGIGGFRIACEREGGECVFSSEWDKSAQKTYEANFNVCPSGDITKIDPATIPQYDLLCAGFPCQSFSHAGKRKGFADVRGTMFGEIARIVEGTKPKAIFLENVKGLLSHDKGNTVATIIQRLEDIGYDVVPPQIVNASHFGVPQKRERVYIAAFRKDLGITGFEYPAGTNRPINGINSILERQIPAKYYISQQYLDGLENHKAVNQAKGNGFGYNIIAPGECANTLMVGGMGHESNLIIDSLGMIISEKDSPEEIARKNNRFVRKMTPREWARLQGFPDTFKIVVSDTQAYKQFGNSVAIPAIQAFAAKIVEKIQEKSI